MPHSRHLPSDLLHLPPGLQALTAADPNPADHRDFIAQNFGRHDVPLFTEACGMEPAPLLDIHEAVPDYASNPDASAAHIRDTIDRILELTPQPCAALVIEPVHPDSQHDIRANTALPGYFGRRRRRYAVLLRFPATQGGPATASIP